MKGFTVKRFGIINALTQVVHGGATRVQKICQ